MSRLITPLGARKYRDMAGIKDLVWHDLRHEGVSRMTEMGIFRLPR